MTIVHEGFSELAAQFRGLSEANSSEASGCTAVQELRKAACQGAAQAYAVAAEMLEEKVRWQRRIMSAESKEAIR